MNCRTIRKGQIADAYREGRLSPEEAAAYERHYFGCPRCFQDLRFRDGLAAVLETEGGEIFAQERFEEERRAAAIETLAPPRWRPAWPRFGPVWAAGAVAAVAAVVAFLVWNHSVERSARIRALARAEPYPYVALVLRGDGREEFRRGMESYTGGNYREAAVWLARSAEAGQAHADTYFFLGVSHLLSGYPADAVRALERSVDLAPSNPVFRWYHAQALLRDGRVEGAEAELERLAEGGEYAERARELLREIAALSGK